MGRALSKQRPDVEIEFQFRESLGDINLNDPLWKMPEKGVFTQDFLADLTEGRADLVVHSWKDLPLDRPNGTRIAATLPRADARDVLLVRKDRPMRGRILTSSPRRSHNLLPFLSWALPQPAPALEFVSVRGNVPTRLSKIFSEDADGLIVAKAALDRLLTFDHPELSDVAREIRGVLDRCRIMVLPLAANPNAAAQGALAIEIADMLDPSKRVLIESINCADTYACVARERDVLGSFGGGCHQKIGVAVSPVAIGGRIEVLKGLTDAGVVLDRISYDHPMATPTRAASADHVFPLNGKEAVFFERRSQTPARPAGRTDFWVARGDAWPEGWASHENDVLWASGLETWRRLAARGLWVSGSSEGRGEAESARVDTLLGRAARWTKLSHDEGFRNPAFDYLATYTLTAKPIDGAFLRGKTHCFWSSGSAFRRALELAPELRAAEHACGLGHTGDEIESVLGRSAKRALDHADWLAKVLNSLEK